MAVKHAVSDPISHSANLLLGLTLFFLHAAAAQESSERFPAQVTVPFPAVQSDSIRIGFEKILNTYRWAGVAAYRHESGPFRFHLREHVRSSLIRIERNQIRDEQSLDLLLARRFSGNVEGKIRGSSFILSDNRSVGIATAYSHVLYGGAAYRPVPSLTIEPYIGYRVDRQVDESDHGPSYLLGLTSERFDIGGYDASIRGSFQLDRLSPRIVRSDTAMVTVDKEFPEGTRNALRLLYSRNRRDFYVAVEPAIREQFGVNRNIESRNEQSVLVSDALDYTLGRQLFLNFSGTIFTRTINRELRYRNTGDPRKYPLNTSIGEFRINGMGQIQYDSRRFDALIRFLYEERDEQHSAEADRAVTIAVLDSARRAEERKDNHAKRTAVGADLTLAFSRSDTLSLAGLGALLRYDTPSSENDDDRDELWYAIGITMVVRPARYLTIRGSAEANLIHLVYLASTRSADNTWNRVLRLAPAFEFRPASYLSTTNRFEVLANYTVYDFEFPTSATRSFSFRQFSFIDSTVWSFSRRMSFEWFSHIRNYERGELRWSEFSERPIGAFRERTYESGILYRLTDGLHLSLGIRYFRQTRYRYAGAVRIEENVYRSVGPTTRMVWSVSRMTVLRINGWHEHQEETGAENRRVANVTLSLAIHL